VGELIPLFPLGTPLFPGITLPLVVFEPRYRRLVHDLLELPADSPRRSFGVVAIRQGWEVERVAPVAALHEVGCTARLRDVRLAPDGRFRLLTVGARRFRVLDVVVSDEVPYLRAEVAWLPEEGGNDDAAVRLLQRSVGALFTEYVAEVAARQRAAAPPTVAATEQLVRGAQDDPRSLSYLVASAALLPPEDRQTLLALPSARARLARESWLLRRELTLLRRLGAVPVPLQELGVPMAVN
jgi:Lon protease-like protein